LVAKHTNLGKRFLTGILIMQQAMLDDVKRTTLTEFVELIEKREASK